jgi:hypothetical protein
MIYKFNTLCIGEKNVTFLLKLLTGLTKIAVLIIHQSFLMACN